MERLASKKSYSRRWDGHNGPNDSKWLAEHLEETDKLVMEMLKLIDTDEGSIAKKAEMYYQRRPELISHVEDFYCMFRMLVERYDNVTGELHNSMTTKTLHTPESGGGSESGSTSSLPSHEHTPNGKLPKSKSTHGAAGFEAFIGSGGSSDISRDGFDMSSLSSDTESEEIKEETIIDSDEKHQRVVDLENEIVELKRRLNEYEEGRMESEDSDDLRSRALDMEKELSNVIERLHASEKEIIRLTQEIEKKNQILEYSENGNDDLHSRVLGVEKSLIDSNKKQPFLEEEKTGLKHDFENNTENHALMLLGKRQATELGRKIMMLEVEVMNLKCEIQQLKEIHTTALEQCKADISACVLEIANINESHVQDKLRLETDVADQARVVEQLKASTQSLSLEKISLVQKVSELENIIEDSKAALAVSIENFSQEFSQEKSRLEAEIFGLSESQMSMKSKIDLLESETMKIQAENTELTAASAMYEELNKNLDGLKHKHDILKSEKDELAARVLALTHDVVSRDDRILNMEEHLQQLNVENAKVNEKASDAQRVNKDMQLKVNELEKEIEQHRIALSDSEEGKREAIRQLCFSLEHYRLGYQELRQVLRGYKRPRSVVVP